MEIKIGHLIILFLGVLIGLAATWGLARMRTKRLTISVAQRALDILEVEKIMSKHKHIGGGAWDNTKELETIWVDPDGPHSKTATLGSPSGIWEGMELIMRYYGTAHRDSQRKELEAFNKLYPDIKVVPENYGIGTWYGGNNPTNPVIEIAGDGKTAKGLWDSNGPMITSSVRDGKVVAQGAWFWRMYAVDFVKEGGEWKIWHMNIVYDIIPPLEAEYGLDWTKYRVPERRGGGDSSDPLGPTRPNPNPYEEWSPLRLPQHQPRIPEPYYTFSETFSY